MLALLRRARRQRVLGALAACALSVWFLDLAMTLRVPGAHATYALPIGLALCAASALAVVHRLSTATPPAWLRPLLEHAEGLAALVVLNLIILSLLSPVTGVLSFFSAGLTRQVLVFLGQLSARLLAWLFVAGIVGLVALLAVRVFGRLAARWAPLASVFRTLHRAALVVLALYGLYASVLGYNGILDTASATAHRAELRAVSVMGLPYGLPSVTRVEVTSWRRPGGTETIALLPALDLIAAWAVEPGEPLRVTVGPGFFGIPWVRRVERDTDSVLEALVRTAPSAASPRLELVNSLLRQRRWPEAAAHAREYLAWYPRDHAFAARVAEALRRGGHAESAARLAAGLGASAPAPGSSP